MSTAKDASLRKPLMSGEESPLLTGRQSESENSALDVVLDLAENANPSSSTLYWNFLLFSLGFSVNHGCVVSCLAYSTAELGKEMGGYGSGVLYVCYALTALFLSKPVVTGVGPKMGLILGTAGYCVYVVAFLAAVLFSEGPLAWIVFMTCCAIGGCAGGILWTAQGRYFAANATKYVEARKRERVAELDIKHANGDASPLHAAERGSLVTPSDAAGGEAEGESIEDITAIFAGLFAMIYLGCETVAKVMSTALFVIIGDKSKSTVFAVYGGGALLAAIAVTRLNHLNEHGLGKLDWAGVKAGALDAWNLTLRDTRLLLLMPYQMNFGTVSTFVPYYIFGIIVGKSEELGGKWVGCLSAIITATGALMGVPAAALSRRFGHGLPMTIGGICTALAGASVFFYSNAEIGTWSFIVPLLVIYGIGRGTWENTNKAVVAALYADEPGNVASAFASVSFTNGFTGAVSYFIFPSLSRDALGVIVVVMSLLAIASYHMSHLVKKNE